MAKKIFLAFAVILTVIPALFTNIKHDVTSDIDNRRLKEFPKTGSYLVDGLNSYVNDRVGFRDEAITAYQIINDRLFHYLIHPLYEYGKDGWIMTREWDDIQTFHLDLEEGFDDRFAAYMKEKQRICNESGADFMFLLIPNKETVYPEYLSDGYSIKEQESKSDKIIRTLESEGVPYLYLLPKFRELKGEIQLYNVKNDSGHWNENGMFYGNVELYDFLIKNFDDSIVPISMDEFDVGSNTEKYLLQSRFPINEALPSYTNKKEDFMTPEEDAFLDAVEDMGLERARVYVVNDKMPDAPRLLVFGDSYFGHEMKFLGNHFSSTCYIHSLEISHFNELVEAFDPDLVIIEATERVVGPDENIYECYNDTVLAEGLR